MAIPNTVKEMVSYFAGLIASDGPTRINTAILKHTLDKEGAENFATPSRACTYNDDGTVAPGGAGVFAGLLVGNQRVASYAQESWFQTGDSVELMVMGELAVNIDKGRATAAVGAPVFFENASGKLGAGTATTGQTAIPGAVITKVGDKTKNPVRAVVALNGPLPTTGE